MTADRTAGSAAICKVFALPQVPRAWSRLFKTKFGWDFIRRILAGTLLYGLSVSAAPKGVVGFSRFGHKQGIGFAILVVNSVSAFST